MPGIIWLPSSIFEREQSNRVFPFWPRTSLPPREAEGLANAAVILLVAALENPVISARWRAGKQGA
jgi:hypothetical protein